ncbi:MAG: alpha/beta hydrolase [Bacteroidota bacterium]|nr:alpha/beta hydrolase [Bacteroidota bacterium]
MEIISTTVTSAGVGSTQAVSLKVVTFKSNGLKIAGHLYLPVAGNPVNVLMPAIVVGHPGAGVKEQTAGLYAKQLAERGFITLTFDAAYQGESEGMPRGLEDPAQRVEDIKAAVSFLNTIAEVDPQNIGVLGICASGGYGVSATATDHRIKAVATVSGVDIGRLFSKGADGTQNPAIIQGMLDVAAADRSAQAKGQDAGVFPVFPANEEQARSMGQHVYEGWEYYCTDRAQHPRSAKVFTWNSIDRIAAFDAFRFADMIAPRPVLMIAGSEAATLWITKEGYENAKEPKELFLMEGASHVALYDQEVYVNPVISKLNDFFRSALV